MHNVVYFFYFLDAWGIRAYLDKAKQDSIHVVS